MSGPLTAKNAFTLRVISSSDSELEGREIRVEDGNATIGRGAECTVVINERNVSRKHARIERVDGGFKLSDLESANGVWLGDRKVTESVIAPGIRFRVGDSVFECVPDAIDPGDGTLGVGEPMDRTVMTMGSEFLVRIVETKEPSHVGEEFRVGEGGATIGRGRECTIALKDKSASRVHARVESLGGKFRLRDVGSSNGVWIGEDRILDQPIEAGQRFRVGDTILECQPLGQSDDMDKTGMMQNFDELMGLARQKLLKGEGEPLAVGGSRFLLLDDPHQCYYVTSGSVDIFAVTLREGRPVGARDHLISVKTGGVFFGFDVMLEQNVGFVAMGKGGTEVRRFPISRLREILADEGMKDHVAGHVDEWVSALAAKLTRDVMPKPAVDLRLEAQGLVTLQSGKKARSSQGILWLESESAALTFVGMTVLLFDRQQRFFPLATTTWVELLGASNESIAVEVRRTADCLRSPGFWSGLRWFHQVLAECQLINKQLAIVDEMQRLRRKREEADAAQGEALGAIGSVLAGSHPAGRETKSTGRIEPVFRACKEVGEFLDINVKAHPDTRAERSFEENVLAVATASRFRTRNVMLRDEWHRRDVGPLLGRIEKTGAPVALLPSSPRSYVAVDPTGGTRRPVTPELALELSPLAYSFYRSLPSGELSVARLLRFAAFGLKRDFYTVGAMGLLVGLLGTVAPFLTGQMMDIAIPHSERSLLLQLGLGMLMAALATAAFKITQSIAVVRIEGKADYGLQAALWDRLLDLPSNFFRLHGAGDLADRAAGINTIRGLIARSGVSGILGAVSSVFYIAAMLMYSAKLALVAIGLTLVLVGVTTLANYLQLRYQRSEMQIRGKIQGLVLQLISGVAKIRVCGAENHAFRVWAQRFSAQRRLSFKIGNIQNLVVVFNSTFPVLSSLAIFYTLWYLKSHARPGEEIDITTGSFIAFNAAYSSFAMAMQTLSDASLAILKVVPVYERLKPILTTIPETDDSKAFPTRLTGEITISHVSFRYREDSPWIIKDLSLKIRPGEFVAFVGGSGCGKSTLMRLMLGFEKPASGALYYDGQDLSSLDLRLLRQQLGVVLQESRVLPTDIFRNIVGTSSRTMDEAWEAAEMAGLAEDVRNMPMQMHTVVSEGGGTFSGGQRQRLLIARALVNKPKIIFLDEATSALDNRTQATVSASMDMLSATRIVIAHRLSTVVNADKICYLEKGEIREMGSYEELMKKNGQFAQLARRQMA